LSGGKTPVLLCSLKLAFCRKAMIVVDSHRTGAATLSLCHNATMIIQIASAMADLRGRRSRLRLRKILVKGTLCYSAGRFRSYPIDEYIQNPAILLPSDLLSNCAIVGFLGARFVVNNQSIVQIITRN